MFLLELLLSFCNTPSCCTVAMVSPIWYLLSCSRNYLIGRTSNVKSNRGQSLNNLRFEHSAVWVPLVFSTAPSTGKQWKSHHRALLSVIHDLTINLIPIKNALKSHLRPECIKNETFTTPHHRVYCME